MGYSAFCYCSSPAARPPSCLPIRSSCLLLALPFFPMHSLIGAIILRVLSQFLLHTCVHTSIEYCFASSPDLLTFWAPFSTYGGEKDRAIKRKKDTGLGLRIIANPLVN